MLIVRQFCLDQLKINGTSWKVVQNFQQNIQKKQMCAALYAICNSSPVTTIMLEAQSGSTYQ